MQLKTLSINLKRIRIARGLTMQEAANAAGISRMAYHNIEKGLAKPRVRSLQNLANTLGVTIFDIVRDVPQLHNVRFRAKWKTKRSKEQREEIKNSVALWMRDFKDLEDMLNKKNRKKFWMQAGKLKKYPDFPKKMAEKSRNWLGLGRDEIIIDICALIESAGIKLHFMNIDLDNFFGFCVNDKELGTAIVVNNHHSITTERKIFTIAHELGHILMHPSSFNDKDTEIDIEEKQADMFASYFLMPEHAFYERLEEVKGLNFIDAILHIKRVFKVSYKTVIYRLIEEKIADEKLWKTFRSKYKQRTKFELERHKEPEPLAAIDCIEDRLSRLVRESYESELISISRAAEILGKSIVEMRELVKEWMALK